MELFGFYQLVLKPADWSVEPKVDTREHWDWSACVLRGVSQFDSWTAKQRPVLQHRCLCKGCILGGTVPSSQVLQRQTWLFLAFFKNKFLDFYLIGQLGGVWSKGPSNGIKPLNTL